MDEITSRVLRSSHSVRRYVQFNDVHQALSENPHNTSRDREGADYKDGGTHRKPFPHGRGSFSDRAYVCAAAGSRGSSAPAAALFDVGLSGSPFATGVPALTPRTMPCCDTNDVATVGFTAGHNL